MPTAPIRRSESDISQEQPIACAAPPRDCRSSSLIAVVTATSLLDPHGRTAATTTPRARVPEIDPRSWTHATKDDSAPPRGANPAPGRTRTMVRARGGASAARAGGQAAWAGDSTSAAHAGSTHAARRTATPSPAHARPTHTAPPDKQHPPPAHPGQPIPPRQTGNTLPQHTPDQPTPARRAATPSTAHARPTRVGPAGGSASAGCAWGRPTRRPTIGLCPRPRDVVRKGG